MATGKKASTAASKALSSKSATKAEKTVAGSDLSQTRKSGGKKK